jgi:homoserine dehydrogenase
VASARRGARGLDAKVALRSLPATHPLAALKNADNCVVVTLSDGQSEVLTGVGAGRWPTTEAVFADLDALARRRAAYDTRGAPVLTLVKTLVKTQPTTTEVAV